MAQCAHKDLEFLLLEQECQQDQKDEDCLGTQMLEPNAQDLQAGGAEHWVSQTWLACSGERPLYEAEMFTEADGEAQRIFPVNPSAHIHKTMYYVMGRKPAGEICQVFRHCQSWSQLPAYGTRRVTGKVGSW